MSLFSKKLSDSKKDSMEFEKLREEILKLNDMIINSHNDHTISYLVGRGFLDIANGKGGFHSAYKNLKNAYIISLRNKLNKRQDLKFIEKLAIPILDLDLLAIINNENNSVHISSPKNINKKTKIFKSTEIKIPKKDKSKLKDSFIQGLTLLDPISEECWRDAFTGFGIVKSDYDKQIEKTQSDFAFFESAWKANNSQWLYAFNSPNLQHDNAQKLLDAIGKLRTKNIPVIFWNKEDPMHYEMFKPIAKEADYVFTTDSQIVEKYRKELNNPNIWSLPFAAPINKTNPIGRFSTDTENICFAGTYYAQNHPERKKQMDALLPALLDNDGYIYNRASQDKSEKYAFPFEYNEIIREGVGFEEMIELYKEFKIFLNVNTIINSPTMMSRRVYELLASGTPVVSTPSKAITAQFPGIVLTATNKNEANIAVEKLLKDNYFWHRQSVLGIREIMSKHTYQIRWDYIKNCIIGNEDISNDLTDLSILARYTGTIEIESFISMLLNQKDITINKLVIINNSNKSINLKKIVSESKYSNELVVVDKYDDAITQLNDISDQYIYFTEDTVINFQNAILDLLLATKYSRSKAISRPVYYEFERLKNKSVDKACLDIGDVNYYETVNESPLTSLLINISHLDDFIINMNEWKIKSNVGKNDIFTIDPFNIVAIKKPKNNRTINNKYINDFIYKYNSWLGA